MTTKRKRIYLCRLYWKDGHLVTQVSYYRNILCITKGGGGVIHLFYIKKRLSDAYLIYQKTCLFGLKNICKASWSFFLAIALQDDFHRNQGVLCSLLIIKYWKKKE